MVRPRIIGMSQAAYAELQCASNFSFLRGASHPEELVAQAHHLGLAALALTDRNTLAGVVRAHAAAKESRTSLASSAAPLWKRTLERRVQV